MQWRSEKPRKVKASAWVCLVLMVLCGMPLLAQQAPAPPEAGGPQGDVGPIALPKKPEAPPPPPKPERPKKLPACPIIP